MIRKNNPNSPFWRAAQEASHRSSQLPDWKKGVIRPRITTMKHATTYAELSPIDDALSIAEYCVIALDECAEKRGWGYLDEEYKIASNHSFLLADLDKLVAVAEQFRAVVENIRAGLHRKVEGMRSPTSAERAEAIAIAATVIQEATTTAALSDATNTLKRILAR